MKQFYFSSMLRSITVYLLVFLSFGNISAQEVMTYETGFESTEGFTAGSVYNNTAVSYSGTANSQWGTVFGTPSNTSPLTGGQSLQMRWYTSSPSSLGQTYMNFDVQKVKRIEFNAANTNGLKLTVDFSEDGGTTYQGAQLFNLTAQSLAYNYTVSNTGAYQNVRLRFTITLPSTLPSGTSRLYLDDVKVYSLYSSNAGAETPVVADGYSYFAGNLVNSYPNATQMLMTKDGKLYKATSSNWSEVYNFSGNTLTNLFVDNNNVVWGYNSTTNKIIKSTDLGTTWTTINPPTVTATQQQDLSLFVRNNKLYYSIMGWSDTTNAMTGFIYTLDTANTTGSWTSLPLNVTSGYSYGLYQGFFDVFEDGSIYRRDTKKLSFDNGTTWTTETFNVPSTVQYPILFISADKQKVMYTSQYTNYKLFVSSNAGASYVQSQGLPFNRPIRGLLFYQNAILCNMNYGTNGDASLTDGIYISTDNGLNFTKLNDQLSFWDNQRIIGFTSDNSNVYVSSEYNGFKKLPISNTSAIDFNNGVNNIVPHHILKLDTDPSGKLYVLGGGISSYFPNLNTTFGLFVSDDGGVNWTKDKNLFDAYRSLYTFSSSNNSTVYSVGYEPGKVSRSTNSGINWSYLSAQHTPYSVLNVFADKNNSNRLIINSNAPDNPSTNYKGTFLSVDGGNSFGAILGGYATPIDNELANDVLYYDTNTIFIALPSKLLKSTNNGGTWQMVSTNAFNKIISVSGNNELYACTNSSLLKSTDLGTSWTSVTLPVYNSTIKTIITVTVSSVTYLVISTDQGVYVLKNGQWELITPNSYQHIVFNSSLNKLFFANANSIKTISTSFLATNEIKQEKAKTLLLYPNPTSDFVNIESKDGVFNTVQVLDMNGKLLKTVKPNSDKVQFSVEEFTSGIYLVKVQTDKGMMTSKIIKK